jgi:hypothetical protein
MGISIEEQECGQLPTTSEDGNELATAEQEAESPEPAENTTE